MSYNISGTIHHIDETKQVSDKFSKREFVVSMKDGKYEQLILVQATNDRIAQLDGLTAGDSVSVEVNLRGRAWTKPGTSETKYFTSIEAWKIERVGESKARGGSHDPAASRDATSGGGDDDQIPF